MSSTMIRPINEELCRMHKPVTTVEDDHADDALLGFNITSCDALGGSMSSVNADLLGRSMNSITSTGSNQYYMSPTGTGRPTYSPQAMHPRQPVPQIGFVYPAGVPKLGY